MNDSEEVASAVTAIIESASSRTGDHDPITVSPRSLEDAIKDAASDGRNPLIAEFKPTSPTADTVTDREPATAAQAMVDGGAAAISVLTEPDYFNGSTDALTTIRDTVDVPVLRKDFIVEESQLDAVSADIILLITRFIDDLPHLLRTARDRGFQVLVEVHDTDELQTALTADPDFIGINTRDLARLTVDRGTVDRLAPMIPDDVTVIAESGVSTPAHMQRYLDAGVDAVLVGTTIMTAADITTRTQELTQA